MDFSLPEELVALREATRRFAQEAIAPHAQEWDAASRYSDELIGELGAQGYMGIVLPEEYGGAAGSYLAFALVLEELARFDGGVALAVEAHNGLCCQHLNLAGTKEQKKKYLPPLARGERIGSWCLTEPSSGTDAAAMKTRARLEGETWVLNGTKQFITNGDRAETFVVMAVTDPERGKEGVSAFAIERGTPGFSTGKPERKLGMRSSDTVSVHLDNVRIPKNQLLGQVDRGFEDVKKVLERGRVMISAISLGLARGALEDSVTYAHERQAFGKPIADFQAIQGKIADMATRLHAARLMLYEAATRLDEGVKSTFEAAATKLFCSEMATEIAMDAIQIHGGYGYLSEYNVERAMRDAKLCEIGEGTSEILRILVARAAPAWLGIDLPERRPE